MGAVLAKFRKEKTTEQLLENLEERIKQIEKYSYNTQEQKKRFVGNFLAISIGVYVIAFLVFYFVYFPPTWNERIIYSVPLLLFPFVIILLRKLFTWYFQRKLNRNSDKLSTLRGEKKKLLEQVMDKETYKVAVNLLNRFGDKSSNIRSTIGMTPRTTNSNPRISLNQTQRSLAPATGVRPLNSSLMATPSRNPSATAVVDSNRALAVTPSPNMALVGANQELRQRRTPFPIVDHRNKSVFERMVDVLIGDGPQDRFAMICKECHAHNGMALKEEFDYATFRCAFCSTLNPSRKSRPVAPRLPEQTSFIVRRKDSTTDSSTDSEGDDVPSRDISDSDAPVDKQEADVAESDEQSIENVQQNGETPEEQVEQEEGESLKCDAEQLNNDS